MTDEDGRRVPHHAASGVAVGGGPWAVNMVFNRTEPQGAAMVDVPEVTVSLPWSLAKALAELLQETIERHERAEGPVTLPKSYIERRAKRLAEYAQQDALPKPRSDE